MGTVHRFPSKQRPEPGSAADQLDRVHAQALADVRAAEEVLLLARADLHRCEQFVRLARGAERLTPTCQAAADAERLWAWASTLPEHPARGLLLRAAERAEVEARAALKTPSDPGVPAPEPLP